MLVKASIAGAIVANTLFMLGSSIAEADRAAGAVTQAVSLGLAVLLIVAGFMSERWRIEPECATRRQG